MQNWWHSLPTRETRTAFSWLTVLHSDLYKFSTYLQSSYVSLTTRKRVTCKNGEGSNACALPCGVGGVREVSEVSAIRKIGQLQGQRTRRPYTSQGVLKFDPPGSMRH